MLGAFRFAGWSVAPDAGRLVGASGAVHLRPRTMEVLVALAERGGEVVGKRELLEQVWGGAEVSEAVLTNAVTELRRALCERARGPGLIETVPRRGYRLSVPAEFERPRADPGRSLAVLPFTEVSPDGAQGPLVACLLDALVGELARWPQLRVVPRAECATAGRPEAGLAATGRRLGVEKLVTGSAVRHAARLRLNVQLVDLRAQRVAWSTSLVTGLGDPVELVGVLSSTLAHEIARALALEPGTVRASPPRLDAHSTERFLRGQLRLRGPTVARLEQGIADLTEVVTRVPDHALAHAELSRGHFLAASWGLDPGGERLARAEEAASRALALDPDLIEGRIAWAMAHGPGRLRPGDALWELARLVARHPREAAARDALAHVLAALGRVSEAIAEERRALADDPTSPVLRSALGFFLRAAGRLDEAAAELRSALELHPDWTIARLELGRVLRAQGRRREAVEEISRAEPEWGRFLDAVVRGRRREVARRLDAWHAPDARVAPYWLAERCLWAGEPERALAALERALEQRQLRVVFAGVDPTFAPLGRRAAFRRLLARVGVAAGADDPDRA